MERFEEYGIKVNRVVNCGGIAVKNPLIMQIYADVLGKKMEISRSSQTGALGSAMAGAVVAGKAAGGYDTFRIAIDKMTGTLKKSYTPNKENRLIYNKLYKLYRQLHDIFGTEEYSENLKDVMKKLLTIRDEVRV
jgi:L-ribulokinase